MGKNTLKQKYNDFLIADQLPPVDDNDQYLIDMPEADFKLYQIEKAKFLLNYIREQDGLIRELVDKVLILESKLNRINNNKF